jgi:hypothetical protein
VANSITKAKYVDALEATKKDVESYSSFMNLVLEICPRGNNK